MQSKVMRLAWALIKSAKSSIDNLSDALKTAWKAIKAKAAILSGGAVVTFTKADGTTTTRTAQPFAAELKGTGRSNALTVVYFDPDKERTGSFRADRLESFIAL